MTSAPSKVGITSGAATQRPSVNITSKVSGALIPSTASVTLKPASSGTITQPSKPGPEGAISGATLSTASSGIPATQFIAKSTTAYMESQVPSHSTEKYELHHSTEVSPLTGDEFGHIILGHSTQVTPGVSHPPSHSTEISPFTTPGPHSTTLSPLPHSTDSTFNTHGDFYHSTKLVSVPHHSSTESPLTVESTAPTKFVASTEITRAESDMDNLSTATTRKILDSKEVLAQLSTEVIGWPFHSTEATLKLGNETDFSTTTSAAGNSTAIRFEGISTEVAPVNFSIVHSTTLLNSSVADDELNITTDGITVLVNHSTVLPFHSTEITAVPFVTLNATTLSPTEAASTSYHLDHSTDKLVHSTELTAGPTSASNVNSVGMESSSTTSESASPTTVQMRHSTDVSTPVPHSTDVARQTTTSNTANVKSDSDHTTGTAKRTTQSISEIHSTQRPMHSTAGVPLMSSPTNATTKQKANQPITAQTTTTATTSRTVHRTTQPPATSVVHSTYRPDKHSTEPTAEKPISKRRKRRSINFNNFFLENVLEEEEEDVADILPFATGMLTDNPIFDIKSDKAHICSLCVWIQPHFAENFGLGGGLLHGVAEVLDLIKFTDQIFRAIDFNQDGIPENIGFTVKALLLSDDIKITENAGQNKSRRKREYLDDGLTDIFGNIYEPGLDEILRDTRDDFEFDDYGSYDKYDEEEGKGKAPKQKTTRNGEKQMLEKSLNEFDRSPKKIAAKNGLAWIRNQLDQFRDCCATMGFIYHDLTPTIAATTERGLCTEQNLGLVSGFQHGHKILKYDVFRGIMHSLGHLFGASHNSFAEPGCLDEQLYEFINPFPLHPIQQSNVGVRPNSFRFSPCTKDAITMFLSSNGLGCLKEEEPSFCGNGALEDGEECDCGSLWQCHLRYPCCGESDTLFGCKIITDTKKRCYRPTIW